MSKGGAHISLIYDHINDQIHEHSAKTVNDHAHGGNREKEKCPCSCRRLEKGKMRSTQYSI